MILHDSSEVNRRAAKLWTLFYVDLAKYIVKKENAADADGFQLGAVSNYELTSHLGAAYMGNRLHKTTVRRL